MVRDLGLDDPEKITLPGEVSLLQWCSPIEDQGALGSCTAQAGVGLIEYFERRAFNTHIDASRLFLYKVTRNLMGWSGDTGAYLRSTMGAMVLFGVPPEKYWRYTTERPAQTARQRPHHFDEEPPAFCYSFAENYKTIQYFRLDPPGIALPTLRERVRAYVAAGLPAMFGFTVFSSINQASTSDANLRGKIPFPGDGERVVGGHAVVAVGYNDKLKIPNLISGAETTGAFLVRNSWGTSWGQGGYGWLPYKYVESGMASDWWILLKKDYVPTGQFGFA
jgi:C1A family cysteine protease